MCDADRGERHEAMGRGNQKLQSVTVIHSYLPP